MMFVRYRHSNYHFKVFYYLLFKCIHCDCRFTGVIESAK